MSQVDVSQALYTLDAAIAGHHVDLDVSAPVTLDREEWPPDYAQVHAWRRMMAARFREDAGELDDAVAYYSLLDAQSCIDFINHWCDTYDPRLVGTGRSPFMPMIMFRRQEEFVRFIFDCMEAGASGLVEKSRDMGATWTAIDVTAWMWRFQPGSVVGWGSNKREQVDVLGNPKSIFEKIRMLLRSIDSVIMPELVEGVHLKQYTCRNPDNGAVIDGEIGENIGRGGRSRVYFVDEAAHLKHPEEVEASLSENTRCRIDISSVSGPGTVFHRKRDAGLEWRAGQPVRRDVANVFVMDWTDHPEKTREWYEERRTYYTNQGTLAVVAREIDRDYTAASEGIIIQYDWAAAAVNAHEVLGFDDDGGWWGGLDLADEGVDKNALVRGRGRVVKLAEEMNERDPGVIARRTFRLCNVTRPIRIDYDSGGGFGGTVKSEFNRLALDADVDMSWLTLMPWNAGARVVDPGERINKGDKQSPTNKDFFSNFKAQAWWNVAQMFYKTFRAVTEGDVYDSNELISIDPSGMSEEVLAKLLRELSQATMESDARLKLRVEKKPKGAKSPNLADALVTGRFPTPSRGTRPSLFGAKVFTG